MELSEGIRKIGFHRWYERQLLESHFYMVTAFLCLILVMACLEGFSFRAPGVEPLLRIGAMFAGVVVCVWTLRRYLAMLTVAMHVAERSVCGRCKAYGALEATAVRRVAAEKDPELTCAPTGVRCRRCGNEWTIE